MKTLKCVCGSDLFMEKFMLDAEQDTNICLRLVTCSFCGKILPSSRDRYKELKDACQEQQILPAATAHTAPASQTNLGWFVIKAPTPGCICSQLTNAINGTTKETQKCHHSKRKQSLTQTKSAANSVYQAYPNTPSAIISNATTWICGPPTPLQISIVLRDYGLSLYRETDNQQQIFLRHITT